VGGSLMREDALHRRHRPVFMYGFFGQVFWMFGGIALLMLLANTAAIRNLAPGMAGALSHAGLTGACTAGDFGEEAARRAPL
jgi:ABC-type Mn2+/Zn2+ transport system permease subunit